MAKVQSILSLHAQGWAQRRIARELGVARETVRKYVEQQIRGSRPANAPTGSATKKKPRTGTEKPAAAAL
jgi:transposase